MSNEPTEVFVDPNTDDLDSFSSLFNGEAKEQETSTEEDNTNDTIEEVETEEVETQEEVNDPDGDDEPEEKPKKKVNRFQERINDLTAKAREAERALEALKAEQAAKSETPAAVSVVEDGPTPDDLNPDGSDKYPLGEFDPNYIRDLTRHTIQKETEAARKQEEQSRAQRQEQEARNALHQEWTERLNPVTEKYDDFLDKTLGLETTFDGLDPEYSDYLVQTIKSLEHGPEVLYYFANHLDEAEKFVRSGPLRATLALGEINSMFKGQTRKEAKVSNAPPPPQVNKGSKTRTTVAADTDNLDAFSEMFFKKR